LEKARQQAERDRGRSASGPDGRGSATESPAVPQARLREHMADAEHRTDSVDTSA
jgi:hypothetical protein